MSPAKSIGHCLTSFFSFKGRASRSEFNWFNLFELLLFIAALAGLMAGSALMMLAFLALAVLCIIPVFAVTSRRAHDLGYPTKKAFVGPACVILLLCVQSFAPEILATQWVYKGIEIPDWAMQAFLVGGSLFILGYTIYFYVKLIFIRGKAGDNAYGPNPVEEERRITASKGGAFQGAAPASAGMAATAGAVAASAAGGQPDQAASAGAAASGGDSGHGGFSKAVEKISKDIKENLEKEDSEGHDAASEGDSKNGGQGRPDVRPRRRLK